MSHGALKSWDVERVVEDGISLTSGPHREPESAREREAKLRCVHGGTRRIATNTREGENLFAAIRMKMQLDVGPTMAVDVSQTNRSHRTVMERQARREIGDKWAGQKG